MAPQAKEEQALEIEALQSIFEEGREFESLSSTEFLLKLVPCPTMDEENHVGLTLHITYTTDYPETAPEWDFEDIKGLPDEKVKALREQVEETINASLGMAMIYSVAETCQDYLKSNNQKALSMHEEMMLRSAKAGGSAEDDDDEFEDGDGPTEEEEWKGLAEKELCSEAERVGPDSFLKWKLAFDAEMIACGVLRRDENKAKTGKTIFFDNKPVASSDGTPFADGGKTEMLVYDAALFGEEDLDDLEDMGDDDQ